LVGDRRRLMFNYDLQLLSASTRRGDYCTSTGTSVGWTERQQQQPPTHRRNTAAAPQRKRHLDRYHYMIPQTFSVTYEHIRFYFLVFLFYTFLLLFQCGRLS